MVDNPANNCDRWRGINPQIAPQHGDLIHLPGHGIQYWQAVRWKTPIASGGELIDHQRPPRPRTLPVLSWCGESTPWILQSAGRPSPASCKFPEPGSRPSLILEHSLGSGTPREEEESRSTGCDILVGGPAQPMAQLLPAATALNEATGALPLVAAGVEGCLPAALLLRE